MRPLSYLTDAKLDELLSIATRIAARRRWDVMNTPECVWVLVYEYKERNRAR